MSEVIFAVPRHEYASYQDLYALIDLSGFETCYIDEIDPQSDNAYIITILNGEVPEAGYPDARAKIVLWDNEWHLDGVPALAGVEYWAADAWYAKQIGAQYVPMGSHVGLVPPYSLSGYAAPHRYYAFDVAFIGYFDGVPRRQVIRQQLIERGINVSPPGGWGDSRNAILNASQAYLHVHQLADAPTIAPLRMVVAAAYRLPVISESVADPGVFREYGYAYPYDKLAEGVGDHINERIIRAPYGEALHQFLCHDYTFRKSVEAAL